ncbi:MAG: hypothetical protein PHH77_12045 [Victivallaceae bacterium]|nr:hypothetical protein [Victivallaceae bacterium]
MREKIENRIIRAIRDAENCGAPEIAENLEEVLKLLGLGECRESMLANGLEMYCGSCCPDCRKAGIDVGSEPLEVGRKPRDKKQKAGSAGRQSGIDETPSDNGRNWLGKMRPMRPSRES